jgi:hypothetical protein
MSTLGLTNMARLEQGESDLKLGREFYHEARLRTVNTDDRIDR